MVDLVYYLSNLLFFDIWLLYYYINLKSSIIFCLSSEDKYLSLDNYLSHSFVIVSELFCCDVFDIFVILLAILLLIKSPVATAIFSVAILEAVLNAFAADCLALEFYL